MKPSCRFILTITLLLVIAGSSFLLDKRFIYPPTLRMFAEQHDLSMGVAVNGWALSNPAYTNLLLRQFNLITPENAMKFGPLSPEEGTYHFGEADRIVYFAITNNLRVRGHTLVWTNQLPAWLTEKPRTRQEYIDILHEHITTVVGRYRGYIYAWDVVNEAVANDGNLASDNFWMQTIGPEYIEMAFRWAHEADPNALLFYNDAFAEGSGTKADGVFALLRDLQEKNVPIHGVGLEMHIGVSWYNPAPQKVAENIRRVAELGLQVHITEMDVRLPQPVTTENLHKQAALYADMLQVCLAEPNCTSFAVWGLTDAHSWIPPTYPGWTAPLIFDEAYKPKPSYHALIDILANSTKQADP